MSKFGNSPLNETGTGNFLLKKKQNSGQNNMNNILPKRMIKTIQQHPKSGHFYSTITYKNSNGITEKFVYVSQNGTQIKDKDKDIYINKITGDIISGNGKKYVLDPLTKTLRKNRNGYIFEDNNSQLPQRTNNSPFKGTMFNYTVVAPPPQVPLTRYGPGTTSKLNPGFRSGF